MADAIVLIQTQAGVAGDVVAGAARLPDVTEACALTGPYDALVRVTTIDRDDLSRVTREVGKLPGVVRAVPCPVGTPAP